MSLLNPWVWLGFVLALAGAFGLGYMRGEKAGNAEVMAEWSAERIQQRDAALAEAANNAKETQRRLDRQQENQLAQDRKLAAARADAAANGAAAEQLRGQAADAARQWRDALGNSPSREQLAAAADAISVCTDLRGRADRRASLLAEYADTARIAGLKCEADYDALTRP